MIKHIILFSICLLAALLTQAQDDATLLVIPNLDAKIIVDGVEKGQTKSNAALRVSIPKGEHYVEAQATVNGVEQVKGEIVQLDAGTQKIVKVEFEVVEIEPSPDVVQVANINFSLPGSIELIAWESENPGQPFPYPTRYYAFEKGDEIIINASMSNKNGTNLIEIATYPDGVVRYTNRAFAELRDLTIKVPERSIYRFTLGSNHALPRNCFLNISRKPASVATAEFNSNVALKKTYTAVPVQEPQDFYINSGSNSLFYGGRSRVVIPVTFPENTVEWFYRFAASRNAEDIENVKQNFGLFGEIAKLLLDLSGGGAAVASLATDRLAQPPGADICDIFLISPEHRDFFESKEDDRWTYYVDPSRKNFKSGNVKVTCCNYGMYYLGIRNPDGRFGISVSLEVVAITSKQDYMMSDN